MASYADFDQSNFPLVTITFGAVKANEENFQAYLDEMSRLYERKEPLIIIFDATNATFPGIKYQQRQAKWLADHRKTMETYCMGTAYVIPNDIIRTVLKAIFSLQQQPVPYEIFATPEGGLAWARSRLVSV